jgi:tetratricopeptide (TPR) repeat protein
LKGRNFRTSHARVEAATKSAWWESRLAFLVALIVITTLSYHRAWHGQQIWDDVEYITSSKLQPVSGLIQIWTVPGTTAQYYPLTYSAFWIAHRLWGAEPFGYHMLNIALHLTSAFLLLKILERLNVPGARLAVVLFTLHPVQVESVAWMSELKNTLSGVFFFGAILAYLKFRYDANRRWALYALTFGLFLMGVLAKSAIAVLPACLLVISWWKDGKLSWRGDVVLLVPFFATSAMFGLLTAWMEKKYAGAIGPDYDLSFIQRCLIAGRALGFYISKLALPQNLTFIYPRWNIDPSVWWQYLFPLAALGLVTALWLCRDRIRGPLAAALLFGGILFPAIGFVNIYPFRYSFVADHFQYLACVAPLTLLAAAVSKLNLQIQKIGSIVLTGVLAVLSWQQTGMYVDMETLWKVTVARNPECWMAHNNLGVLWLARGDLDAAISAFTRTIELRPDAEAHNNLGTAFAERGESNRALSHFEQAIALKPDYAEPYNGIGTIRQERGDIDGAISMLQKAADLKPNYGDAQYNLGVLLLQAGRADAAIPHLRAAVAIRPDDAEARLQLDTALHATR